MPGQQTAYNYSNAITLVAIYMQIKSKRKDEQTVMDDESILIINNITQLRQNNLDIVRSLKILW